MKITWDAWGAKVLKWRFKTVSKGNTEEDFNWSSMKRHARIWSFREYICGLKRVGLKYRTQAAPDGLH